MTPTIETVLVSLGAGLFVMAVGVFVPRLRRVRLVLAAIGVGLISLVLWPRAVLVSVPDLSSLSRDQAELRLSSMDLISAAQPQASSTTRPDHVVTDSQRPLAGTRVRRQTVVHFGVGNPTTDELAKSDATGTAYVSIFSPTHDGVVMTSRGADNVFRFEVAGTLNKGSSTDMSLLLWVQPIDPPSDQAGWYLQRLPTNGVQSISSDRWRGICQIGNATWPPHDGDVVDVAASVVSRRDALRLQASQGPITATTLPGTASDIVRLKIQIR